MNKVPVRRCFVIEITHKAISAGKSRLSDGKFFKLSYRGNLGTLRLWS